MRRNYLILILVVLIIGTSFIFFTGCNRAEEKNATNEEIEAENKKIYESYKSQQKSKSSQKSENEPAINTTSKNSYSISEAKEKDDSVEAILDSNGMCTFPDKVTYQLYTNTSGSTAPLKNAFLLRNDTINSITKFNIQNDKLITFIEKPKSIYKVIETFKTVPLHITKGQKTDIISGIYEANNKISGLSTEDIESINDISAEEFINQYLDNTSGLLNLNNCDRSEVTINYYVGTDYHTETISINEFTGFVYNDKESMVSGVEKTQEGYFIVDTLPLESGTFYFINSTLLRRDAVFQAQ